MLKVRVTLRDKPPHMPIVYYQTKKVTVDRFGALIIQQSDDWDEVIDDWESFDVVEDSYRKDEDADTTD